MCRGCIPASYLRAREHYSLPIELKDHVDFVAGINRLHHADGSAAVMERLTDAKAPATAALPAGSASIPLAAFGGGDLMVQVLPRCSDGSVTTAFNVCSSTASPIRSLTVTVAPNDASLGDAAVSTFSSTTLAKLCQSCSAFKGDASYGNAFVRTCGTAATSYGITNVGKVQVCRLPLTRVVTAANSTVSVKTFFADGSNSTGSAGELSTFIEPMVTPESIRSMYVVDATGAGVGSQSVAEFLGQFYSPSDLEAYLSHFHVATTNVTVVGPNDANDAGGEASLDIQVSGCVAVAVWSLPNQCRRCDAARSWLAWLRVFRPPSTAPQDGATTARPPGPATRSRSCVGSPPSWTKPTHPWCTRAPTVTSTLPRPQVLDAPHTVCSRMYLAGCLLRCAAACAVLLLQGGCHAYRVHGPPECRVPEGRHPWPVAVLRHR